MAREAEHVCKLVHGPWRVRKRGSVQGADRRAKEAEFGRGPHGDVAAVAEQLGDDGDDVEEEGDDDLGVLQRTSSTTGKATVAAPAPVLRRRGRRRRGGSIPSLR